jgi:hypothetical protein
MVLMRETPESAEGDIATRFRSNALHNAEFREIVSDAVTAPRRFRVFLIY